MNRDSPIPIEARFPSRLSTRVGGLPDVSGDSTKPEFGALQGALALFDPLLRRPAPLQMCVTVSVLTDMVMTMKPTRASAPEVFPGR